ncbi:hypothetical protein Tco_0241438 [Tanacetum coccineum]
MTVANLIIAYLRELLADSAPHSPPQSRGWVGVGATRGAVGMLGVVCVGWAVSAVRYGGGSGACGDYGFFFGCMVLMDNVGELNVDAIDERMMHLNRQDAGNVGVSRPSRRSNDTPSFGGVAAVTQPSQDTPIVCSFVIGAKPTFYASATVGAPLPCG